MCRFADKVSALVFSPPRCICGSLIIYNNLIVEANRYGAFMFVNVEAAGSAGSVQGVRALESGLASPFDTSEGDWMIRRKHRETSLNI